MTMTKRLLLLLLSLAAFLGALGLARAADVIPSNRRFDWQVGTNVGVPGGIYQYRSRTVVNITGLDNTGATDVASALQGWIDGAADDVCLLLPAGTFRLNSGINVGKKSDNTALKRITLRGAGMGQTILKTYGSANVAVAGGGGFPTNYPTAVYVAADVAAGATTITTDVAHDNGSGLLTLIEGAEDNTIPTVGAIPNPRSVMVRCTGTPTSTTFTFEPALPFSIKAGSRMTRELGTGAPSYTIHTYRCGLEDLTVDGENSTSVVTLGFFTARESWLYNVEVKNITNYGINSAFTMNCSVLHCVVRDQFDSYPSFTSRNLVLIATSTALDFSDNVMFNSYSSMELNAGVTMSTFTHNISDRACIRGDLGSDFNINHGSHNSWNLYEGNILCRIQSDGYFGSASDETLSRNWFHGTSGYYPTDWGAGATTVTGNRLPITLNRLSRKYNIVGNQVGRTVSGVTWEYGNAGRDFDTTSASNLTLATGAVSATIGTGLRYNDNGTCAIFYSAADPTKWLTGRITSYVTGTGSCTFTVYRKNGTGTASDWIVKGGSGYGNNNLYSLGGPNIGGGGLWFEAGSIVAPQTLNIWWPAWDGKFKVWRGNYNSATAYSISGTGSSGTVDAVYFVANGQYLYNGGNGILVWLAANPAKNGLATWDEPGPSSVDWTPIGQNGLQELDYDVFGTAILKGNWNILDNAVPSNESLGGDTIATSYAYSAKPGYLGDRSWPCIDPTSPSQSFTLNAAGYRLVYYYTNATWVGSEVPGYDPDDSGGAAPAAPTHTPGKLRTLRRR